MELTLPVLIETQKKDGRKSTFYRTSLLFQSWISANDEFLQRATSKLIQKAKKEFDLLGRSWSHRELMGVCHNPELETRRLKLKLDLKNRIAQVRYFLVLVKAFDRQFVFCPSLRHVWFELKSGDSLESRATEVFQKYFRDLFKESGDEAFQPERFNSTGESWVTPLEIDVRIDQEAMQDSQKKLMALWSQEEIDGATELYRVGRCLDWNYPDDLARAIGREEEVEQLEKLLNSDARPVMLHGERLVGKTSMIHQVVRRFVEREGHSNHKGNFWLLSPQRLISGMSYVGQWENRFLAIVREAIKKKHFLYFDDVLGLFQAGRTSQSSLSVADLLKNEILKSDLRVLAEITPDAHDKLTERDRAFADLFHVQRIRPTSSEDTMKILVQVIMDEESRQHCEFDFSAATKVIQLQRQYNRQCSFPGKAAKFVRDLALKRFDSIIDHRTVLNEFATVNGIASSLIDDEVQFEKAEVIQSIRNSLIGQRAAVEACADVIGWTKAKLNDPEKPLATMLFLGPTGVGKTECAKTLAKNIFRSEEQMVRFDLNEFKSAYSVSRLIGTLDEPDGLLTSAVRQRPFSVILLDEIEKAHPDVFDILLQVTGEGRLTDSLGRTSDFTNCVLIMTSNLGAAEQSQSLGFVDKSLDTAQQEHRFVRAAQNFFRPEFFNRIDKVIPFEPLSRDQIESIAQQMMQQVVSREGLVRRRCILNVDHVALKRLAAVGYHPKMGARALKRAIEQEFTQPLAEQLASIRNEVPTVIKVQGTPEGRFDIAINALNNIEPTRRNLEHLDDQQVLDRARRFLFRFEEQHLANRPPGEISGAGISPELLQFVSLSEQASVLREELRKLGEILDDQKSRFSPPVIQNQSPRLKRSQAISANFDGSSFLKDISGVSDIHEFVNDTINSVNDNSVKPGSLTDQVVDECCLLDAMGRSIGDEAYFFVHYSVSRRISPFRLLIKRVATAYEALFETELSLNVHARRFQCTDNERVLLFQLKGGGVSELLDRETGCQLYCESDGSLGLIRTGRLNLNVDKSILMTESSDELPVLEDADILAAVDESLRCHDVIRMYDYQRRTIDLRTGTANKAPLTGEQLYRFILSGLPQPVEFKSDHREQPS